MGKPISTAERLPRLDDVLAGGKSMLIAMQDNPDPDAIAAAAALREIAKRRHQIVCSLGHGGVVGRAENQALLRYLALNPRPLDGIDLERFDRIALVDAQPGTGNVSLPDDLRLDVVIDHHPVRNQTRSARYTDIRRSYGATATILHQYLTAAKIPIEPRLATALLYGIRSDTQDFGREATRADIDAHIALYPHANLRALARIESAPLPREYFSTLRRALASATLYDDRVTCYLGELESPDMVAVTADLLLRVEGVTWSLSIGAVGDYLHASLRTTSSKPSAGEVAHRLAGKRGFGGGHAALAAAQIPLLEAEREVKERERLVARLVRRFLSATGPNSRSGEPLARID